jgi:hypothetical protein
VQLALSIARKVLHREAQVDPLLLMGIVRVALERIEGATGVTLAVHPEQVPEWRQLPGCAPRSRKTCRRLWRMRRWRGSNACCGRRWERRSLDWKCS